MDRRFVALAVLSCLAAGCATTDPAVTAGGRVAAGSVAGPGSSSIAWGPCDIESADPAAECGSLSVPLDHDEPDGERIDIGLVRIPADDPDRRIGSILFNPGGPGGSGVDMVTQQIGPMRQLQFPDLADRFDLIGFDPRGVDRSAGIRCVDDAWLETHVYIDATPDNPEEETLVEAAESEFSQACLDTYGDSLIEYDTANTARDMDLIRKAVGDEGLTYYGASYGTLLGAVYATLFPDNVRALVLDSAYDPSGLDGAEQTLIQLRGFEGAFANWVAWCSDNEACTFGSTDVERRWTELRDRLDTAPAPAADGRAANRDVMTLATAAALYSKATWPLLAGALRDAESGDGTALFALTDPYNGRQADGTWTTIEQAGKIIRCASGLGTAAPADPAAAAAEIVATSPHFGFDADAADLTAPCGEIPTGSIPTLDYSGSAPILVVGGTNDPATPFVWAEQMTAALGSSTKLLTFTGEGHAAMFASGCVRQAAITVLLDATQTTTTTCEPDQPAPRPDWFDGLPLPAGFTPIDLLGAEELLGLDPATMYATSFVTASGSPADELAATIEEAGWNSAMRAPLDLDGATDGEQLAFVGPGGNLAALVLGPATLALPDLVAFSALVPTASTLVVLIAV